MPSLNFVLRPSIKKGRHPGSLFLRVIHNRKVKTMTLSCYLFEEEWNASQQTVVFPENNPNRINYLIKVKEKMDSCLDRMNNQIAFLEEQGYYAVEDIMTVYRRSIKSVKLNAWVETLSKELLNVRQRRLAEAYRTVTRRLIKYNKGKDISLDQINAYLIKGFERELVEQGKKPNTISFYMRNLRSIYNKAVESKYIQLKQEHPFTGVYTKVKSTTKRALTVEEITRLYKLDWDSLQTKSSSVPLQKKTENELYSSWRLFMFCFFAQGMCFVDMAHLKKENVKDGVCVYYRKKTLQQVVVVVNEVMQKIIDSFADEVKDSPYLFPIIKVDDEEAYLRYESGLRIQNHRLRTLAKLAGINKRVTTHVARHSFATIARDGGIPIGVISEMLGHTTEKMTHNYLASFDQSSFDKAYTVVINAIKSAGVSSIV